MDYKQALTELAELKEKALSELGEAAAIDDATPEQRFETAMNLLRFEYKKSVVEDALAAAKEVEDDAQRSELLTRLVNEIDFLQENLVGTEAETPAQA